MVLPEAEAGTLRASTRAGNLALPLAVKQAAGMGSHGMSRMHGNHGMCLPRASTPGGQSTERKSYSLSRARSIAPYARTPGESIR